MRRWIAALLFVAVPAAAQRTTPASQEELDAITTRGVRLAIYDRVAWIATDSVLALHPDQSRIQMYIAHPDPATGRFVVLFGRLNAARDTFLVAYRVIEHEQPGIYSTVTVDPSAPAVEQETAMARALDLARRDFGVPQRPYNIAVLATEGGVWSVYAIPAPTSRSPYPLGGD